MIGDQPDYTRPCPGCGKPIGEHKIAGYADCLKQAGFDYQLPYEDIPDAPMRFPGIEGELVGEVTVAAGYVDTAIGRMPILRFIFTGAGDKPMERRSLTPITLLMDSAGLKGFRQLVSTTVDRSILAARRGR